MKAALSPKKVGEPELVVRVEISVTGLIYMTTAAAASGNEAHICPLAAPSTNAPLHGQKM